MGNSKTVSDRRRPLMEAFAKLEAKPVEHFDLPDGRAFEVWLVKGIRLMVRFEVDGSWELLTPITTDVGAPTNRKLADLQALIFYAVES